MELQDALARYPDEALDQLARDKMDDIANVRLPRSVVEQEVAAALSSYSYIADVLAASRPPTYAFLKLLMEAEDHSVPATGFKEVVTKRTDETTAWIGAGDGLPAGKNYGLYRAVLLAAWEEGGVIDACEARLLEVLRSELGITVRESLLLEHHPEVRPIWDSPKAFETVRNHLLSRGLVMSVEDRFVLPNEVRLQIRRYWGMELHDSSYRRLLDKLNMGQLRRVLQETRLPLSGTKEERVERIVQGLVAPSNALESLSTKDLRELAREEGVQPWLPKGELIGQIVHHFDVKASSQQPKKPSDAPPEPESRMLDNERLAALLSLLSGNQLYELLGKMGLKRSGSKSERIDTLLQSPYSEQSLLSPLRRSDLAKLCRRLELQVSGPKDELIDRLLGSAHGEKDGHDDETTADVLVETGVLDTSQVNIKKDQDVEVPVNAAWSEVKGLHDVQNEFSELEADEQVVVALLSEARSLNERDIERLAARYQLGWILTKAHMAEIMRKLADSGKRSIRVRSTGAANIYEWVDGAQNDPRISNTQAARDVIGALRSGVVPEEHLDLLAVGHEQAREHLLRQIEEVAGGRSEFKFVKGPYGSGKSFLCAWLRDRALDNGFAASTVRISADMSLADLATFYAGLMDGLRTPEKRHASAFSDVLESWLLAMQRRAVQQSGFSLSSAKDREALTDHVYNCIQSELSHLATLDPGLAPALRAFFEARLKGDEQTAMAARAWLRGERSLSASTLRALGVRGVLEADQVLPRLRAFLHILNTTRLRGLVALIDELELVRRRPHKRERDEAYETLRALIDEAGQNRLPGCYLIFTGTDTFFDDRRYGLASYEALLHRISPPELSETLRSLKQPVLQLEGLDEARLFEVAQRVRAIHSTAYGWPSEKRVADGVLRVLVEKWARFGGESIDRLPRPFLRHLVHVLDLCEENPHLDPIECIVEPEEDPEASEAILQLTAR